MKTLNYVLLAVAGVFFAMAVNASAGDSPAPNPFFVVLNNAKAAELPAKAAELVSQADSKQRQQTTIDVVKAAVPLNPASAPAIVGSIAQSVPKMAAIAAATAVGLVPDQAAAIARAAAAAAPHEAAKIVEAMCQASPVAYRQIAEAVASVVPGADKEIYAAITTAIPSLKDSLNQVLASYNGNVPSMSSVLVQVKSSVTVAAAAPVPPSMFSSPMLAPPVVNPPYVPLPESHQDIDPGSGGLEPGGGRNYATP